MIHSIKWSVIFIVGLSALLWATEPTFTFTAIPDQDDTRLTTRFSKISKYLSEKLGISVTYIPVKSYAASVSAFRNNQIHMAWFGGLSGVQARRGQQGAVAIAQGEEDQSFVTYFIAHAKTKLTYTDDFPEGIKNKTFTFGSKGSTSGRLMPEYFIRHHFKKNPKKIFKRVGFSGDHSKTISLVQSGAYQVGVVNFKVWEEELKRGIIDTTKVAIIWKTPPYPDYNWTIRGDVETIFGEGFITKVQKVLLDLNDADILKAFPRKRFIAANNELYKPIAKTAIAIGLIDD